MEQVRARVISQEKGLYRIRYEDREYLAEVSGKFRYEARTVSDFPAVGDYVIASIPDDGSNSIISDLFPRKSVFIRRSAGSGKQEQVVAANIDTVFLCMSLNQDFNLRRLERYLSIAWESGARPVIVLTKADLCEDIGARQAEVFGVAAGADITKISSFSDDYEALFPYLEPGKTIALLGSSGVGKSTLINKLLGRELLATNGLRNDDKGRHTTTHRELLELPNGAFVIDTPGMRELGMWDNTEGVDTAFSDVESLTERCRYRNCTHSSEPGCAIRNALENGLLLPERWESYCKLRTESEYAADNSSYLRAKEEKFKQISKINKKARKKN